MNEIYNKINERSGGKYAALRFPKVTFGRTAEVTVVCKPEDKEFVSTEYGALSALIAELCAFHMPVTLRVSDEVPSAQSLRAAVAEFTEKFNYVSSMLHTICASAEPNFSVSLKMHHAMHELAQNDYLPRLKEFLLDNYAYPVELKVEIVEFAKSGTVAAAGGASVKPTEYDIFDVRPVIGDLRPQKAGSVSSINAQAYNVTACGVFAMPTEFTSKAGQQYYRFLLYDGELSLQCRLFLQSGTGNIELDDLIGKTVCVSGNADYEAVRNEASVTVKELSLCAAKGIEPVPQRDVPATYSAVFPREYEEYVQSSMFDGGMSLPEILKGDFVVFDFETTGLSVLYDRPTELGAVKISGGSIKEIFTTLIDPRREIPPDVVEKTGITNEMVKGKPLFEDILPDFYKFTYGCSVVCHNIAFDFPFLLRGGNRSGWAFGDRRTFDTMGIAPRALPGIQRLSLDKVLEALGLTNDNAHRALSDAVATAKAFIAMQRRIACKK